MYNKQVFRFLTIILVLELVFLFWKYNENDLKIKTKITLAKSHYPVEEIPFPIDHYSNKENKTSTTIIVSHFAYNKFFKQVIKNHREYAKKHKYDYWFRNGILSNNFFNPKAKGNITLLGLYWQKLIAIKEAMNIIDNYHHKYNWVMWIDGDAIFTNNKISLEILRNSLNVTDKDYFIVAKDTLCDAYNVCPANRCINSGVLLIRNNKAARQFIQNIIDSFPVYKNFTFAEQAAIQDQIFRLIERKKNKIKVKKYTENNKCNTPTIAGIKIVEPYVMNSCYSDGTIKWKAKDFIAHFAGTAINERDAIISEFIKCIDNKKLTKCEYKEIK